MIPAALLALSPSPWPVPVPVTPIASSMGGYWVLSWTQGGKTLTTKVYQQVDGEYTLIDTLAVGVITSNPGLADDGATRYYLGIRHLRGARESAMVYFEAGP
jgi:hypothetical protein